MYGDKLIDVKDIENFKKLKYETAKAAFEVSGLIVGILCVCKRVRILVLVNNLLQLWTTCNHKDGNYINIKD